MVAPEPVEQRLRGNGTHPSRILRDHGNSRLEQVRKQEVVEADQRDLVMLSKLSQRADRPDRDKVLASEERGWGWCLTKDLERGLLR
jgi:hypothetical protein